MTAFNKIFYLSIFSLFCISCAKEQSIAPTQAHIPDSQNIEEGSLSIKQALNNLDFIYRNVGKKQGHKIAAIETLKKSDFDNLTRSTSDTPLVYVINFEDDNGYAILGANKNTCPIIMIGDQGNFATDKYKLFLQSATRNSICTKDNTDIEHPIGSDSTDIQQLQYTLLTNAINKFPGSSDFTTIETDTIYRDTTVLMRCYPLTKSKWNQSDPYNYYAPIDPKTNRICVAGCVPVAAAQILSSIAYHQNFRTTKKIGDISVDWDKIMRTMPDTTRYQYHQYTSGSLAIAKLIRAIGIEINADYSSSATWAFSSNVKTLLETLGFKNVSYKSLIKDDIFEMIVLHQLPVYSAATRIKADGSRSSHAFVLDGWLKVEYTQEIKGVILSGPRVSRHTFDLVHCNFGWGGQADGYYIPGAFNLNSSEYKGLGEEDDSDVLYNNYNYNLNVYEIIFNI